MRESSSSGRSWERRGRPQVMRFWVLIWLGGSRWYEMGRIGEVESESCGVVDLISGGSAYVLGGSPIFDQLAT